MQIKGKDGKEKGKTGCIFNPECPLKEFGTTCLKAVFKNSEQRGENKASGCLRPWTDFPREIRINQVADARVQQPVHNWPKQSVFDLPSTL